MAKPMKPISIAIVLFPMFARQDNMRMALTILSLNNKSGMLDTKTIFLSSYIHFTQKKGNRLVKMSVFNLWNFIVWKYWITFSFAK